jgi:hypothetical protein
MNQYQITTRPRHLRYVCFVDSQIGHELLLALMANCQRMWGGRYTPIVPVHDNVVSDGYLGLLKHYDPDYVLCSAGVDKEAIQNLRLFNPLGYFDIDDRGGSDEFSGVYALHLVSQFDQGTKILFSEGISNLEHPLLDFYKLNFDVIRYTYAGDDEITKHLQPIKLTEENFATLNQTLHQQKPIYRSKLARINTDIPDLQAVDYLHYDLTEIVVARDKDSIVDLLYFWNRLLFQGRNALYLTVEELVLLCNDQFFGGVLYDMSTYEHPIEVVSLTLTKTEIEDLITNSLRPISFHRAFRHRDIASFPFEVRGASGYRARDSKERATNHTLMTEKGLVHLPLPSFLSDITNGTGKWAVDMEISQSVADHRNQLLFPLTARSESIERQYKGRVRLDRQLSLVVPDYRYNTLDARLEIPSFPSLLRQLVMMPVIHGTMIHTKLRDLGPHDSSNRLAAFLRIFNNDFDVIWSFFSDKFWVDTFEKLAISGKVAGDAITFDELVTNCVATLRNLGIELGPRESTIQNEGNLRLGLRRTVQELCDYRALLTGFKLKCSHCASIFWYPLKNTAELVNCFGCLQDFVFFVEQPFAYKLNDIIKNNLFQSQTQRDGNLTVIRALANLHSRARNGFGYSTQVNLYDNTTTYKPVSDLDIAALVDGKLVIGEAKHSSKLFFQDNRKSLLSLIEAAKEIHPDELMLVCYEDEHDKLNRASQFLAHYFRNEIYKPTITTLLIEKPTYFHLSSYRYFYH